MNLYQSPSNIISKPSKSRLPSPPKSILIKSSSRSPSPKKVSFGDITSQSLAPINEISNNLANLSISNIPIPKYNFNIPKPVFNIPTPIVNIPITKPIVNIPTPIFNIPKPIPPSNISTSLKNIPVPKYNFNIPVPKYNFNTTIPTPPSNIPTPSMNIPIPTPIMNIPISKPSINIANSNDITNLSNNLANLSMTKETSFLSSSSSSQAKTIPVIETIDIRDLIYQTLLDIAYLEGIDSSYKEKAFSKAAISFYDYEGSLEDLINKKVSVPNIGNSSLEIIKDIVENGSSQRLKKLRESHVIDSDKLDTMKLFTTVYGIGREKADNLYNNGYRTIEDLKRDNTLNHAQQIGVKYYKDLHQFIPRNEMVYWQDEITDLVGGPPEDEYDVIYWMMAGSYSREENVSGDIDIIVRDTSVTSMVNIINPLIKERLVSGDKKFIGLVKTDKTAYRQLDIRSFTPEEWPFGVLYNCSGKNFNILIRQRASKLGYRLTEYGLFNKQTGEQIKLVSEKDIFDYLKIQYVALKYRSMIKSELPTY